jgi:hypothetical protein
MYQRWHDLLFAHWPLPAESVRPLIPPELELDTFDGQAWVGVIPFWMSRVHVRGLSGIECPNVRERSQTFEKCRTEAWRVFLQS